MMTNQTSAKHHRDSPCATGDDNDDELENGSETIARTLSHTPTPAGSHAYATAVCIFASLGGLFFGYDQGVTGGAIAMDSFRQDFCTATSWQDCAMANPPGAYLTFTTLYNVLFYLGAVIGASSAGVVCDRFGRRATIFFASLTFIIGTLWVILTPAKSNSLVLVGRIVEGMGVGLSSFSVPIFGAEMAPKELRGLLSGFMQMTVVAGILIANFVNYAVKDMSGDRLYQQGWRLTNAVAIIPPAVLILGIWFVPESPRWLYQRRNREAAKAGLIQLRRSEDVETELQAIALQVDLEGANADDKSCLNVCDASVRRRLLIAICLQVGQNATGINPIFTYGGLMFEQILGNAFVGLLVLSFVNFFATMPALYWVDRFGRRVLLLIGAAGMMAAHLVVATAYYLGCSVNVGAESDIPSILGSQECAAGEDSCEVSGTADPQITSTESVSCTHESGIIIVTFAAIFVGFFAISWGPICWIYPAEIFPLHVRAHAVSIATASNWIMGALMIGVLELFPVIGIDGVFYLFSALCGVAGVFVYAFCPETKGIPLELIETLFVVSSKKTVDGTAAIKSNGS